MKKKSKNSPPTEVQSGAKPPQQVIQTKLNSDREEAAAMSLI